MTLYGFSRKDVTRQLSDFAKKDLISGYPTDDVLQHGLGEFHQGMQTAADMELYAFASPVEIPAAVPVIEGGGQVRMEASVSPERCWIYKPYPRSREGDVDDNQEVDVEVITTGKGAAEGVPYGDAKYYVYNTFPQAIPANTISFCAVFGGVLFAIDKPLQQRVRFRLKTNFNDAGVATAYVLDQFGNAGLAYGSEITVCDPRKLFAQAVGADALTSIHNANPNINDFLHAGGSVGYAVLTYKTADNSFDCEDDCTHPSKICYPRWEVEQCTQIANKMKVQIDALNGTGKITGELGEVAKQLKFNPSNAFISHWPYVDYPPEIIVPLEGSDYKINVYNPHMFTALDGWAIIERVGYSSRLQNAANRCVPYSQGATDEVEWHIVDVQKPIARWVCASFQGSTGNWSYESSQEGYDPTSPDYFTPEGETVDDHILTHECLEIDCLEHGQKGVGYWDPNDQNYQIISTNSALYGKAVDLEAIARKVSDPPSETPLLDYNGCDLEYQQMSPFKVFGANEQCPETVTPEVISPNLVPVDVVSNVTRPYLCTVDGTVVPAESESQCNAQGGTWAISEELCFTYDTVYVCRTDSGVSDDCINVCCDEPDPPPSECIDCTQCPEESIDFTSFSLSWANVTSPNGGIWNGNAVLGTAVWTQNDDCCANLSVTLHSDDPLIPDTTYTATVCIEPSGGNCPFSTWQLTLAWSQPTFAGVTLPTIMCGGMNVDCAGDYGKNGAGVIPTTPDNNAGGAWGEADISITACTP